MSLQPLYLQFLKLCQGRLFRIPEYQRPYSWEKKQRVDLFQDILAVLNKNDINYQHFMATLVALNTKEKITIGQHEYEIVEIVDGQQRITTLIILLKEISDYILENDFDNYKIAEELKNLLIKRDNSAILLQTNHDSNRVFSRYLKEGYSETNFQPLTTGEENLKNAIIECKYFIQSNSNNEILLNILRIVQNRLGFLYYEILDEGMVYTTFEVLNSRGRPVEWLDKTKSMLMGIIYEKYGVQNSKSKFIESHKIWTKLYEKIGIKNLNGDEILRYAATLMQDSTPSRVISSEISYEFLKEKATTNPNDILKIMNIFVDIASKLEELYDDQILNTITSISHARLLYLAIVSSKDLSAKDKTNLKSIWEKISFLIFGISKKDSRTAVGEYVRIAYEIYKNKHEGVTEIVKNLKSIASSYDIESEVNKLIKERDCYTSWTNELRYILYHYELSLAKQLKIEISNSWSDIWNGNSAETIEHIFPQEPGNETYWKGKFGRGNSVIIKNVNRIGNLTVLPKQQNSIAGNSSFPNKKEIYKKSNLLLMKEIIKVRDWNKKALENREETLKNFIIRTWQVH
ncbi:DUF262 domain-containing protein [Leptospira stimsonii]|uniref:DUF262 domain-containing protein n=1 Tax=Leptospira stimsonii TaxID=2202203 RepID=A0A8B3CKQ9_9LEPT|nr:DUF262 domain-containing protein [Leptospira stimsonii]RHX83565.1 hypothetical protein DLM78_21480 [Leptospira stimsonii]